MLFVIFKIKGYILYFMNFKFVVNIYVCIFVCVCVYKLNFRVKDGL